MLSFVICRFITRVIVFTALLFRSGPVDDDKFSVLPVENRCNERLISRSLFSWPFSSPPPPFEGARYGLGTR